ncbi:MAG: WecB/TagA/CpsF family glycosyltransferase [Proteobacteria bacterium]|nr:WecB/TagA/CpsF family glycosyltransferase [Pseudomonadota bacterium]
MLVAVISYENAAEMIIKWTSDNLGQYVCVSNVHMCMESFDSSEFCQVVNNADLVVPDGMPLVWALKLLGEKQACQVRGSDLLLTVCAKAEKKNIPIGLYGGTPDSLQDFKSFLAQEFPSLHIACCISPPFRALDVQEEAAYVKQINASGVRILFVGIGCPKQEKWMAAHNDRLGCVMIGVGAAFDFFSGRKKHAPRWMQKSGLEWVFRLANDPQRLWKRYLKHNPRFVWYFLKQWLSEKFNLHPLK